MLGFWRSGGNESVIGGLLFIGIERGGRGGVGVGRGGDVVGDIHSITLVAPIGLIPRFIRYPHCKSEH